MSTENEVYFLMTGEESHTYVLVRLFSDAGGMKADSSIKGQVAGGAEFDFPPAEGEPHEVLRNVREFAGLRGLDIRIQLDGVEWDPELGTLV